MIKSPNKCISTIIIRPGALGDTLMLLPGLALIPARSNVAVVGRRPGIDFLQGVTGAVLDIEQAHWHHLFSPHVKPAELPFNNAERVIAFFSDPDPLVESNLHHYFPQAHVHLFPSLPPPRQRVHAAWHIANCIQQSGAQLNPEQAIKRACSAPLIEICITAPGHHYVIHPGSGSTKKNYSPQLFVDLLSELSHLSMKPMVLLGPAELGLKQYFLDKTKELDVAIIICPQRDELLNLLGNCSFYIGHDSGITHLCAMLGSPTIALFKASNAIQWQPLGPRVHVIDGVINEKLVMTQVLGLIDTITKGLL